MKTTTAIIAVIRGSSVALIMGAILAATTSANAQYKVISEDGIAASPKVRAMLDERKARPSAPEPSMACPKCKDIWVAQRNTDPKGVGARTQMGNTTKLVAQHLCRGCGVDWSIEGTGKAKQLVAAHKCSACGSENLACCVSKGASQVATRGMEKKVQIAPVR